jgi:hypothetical protein
MKNDILERICVILNEEMDFKKKQKSHLQHHIINKLSNRSIAKLIREINAGNDKIVLLKREAEEIVNTALYIRDFIIKL